MAEPGSISGRSWQLSSGLNRGAEGIKLAACGTHNCRHNRWLPVDMPPADASSLRSMVWRDSKGLPLIGPTRRHVHQCSVTLEEALRLIETEPFRLARATPA